MNNGRKLHLHGYIFCKGERRHILARQRGDQRSDASGHVAVVAVCAVATAVVFSWRRGDIRRRRGSHVGALRDRGSRSDMRFFAISFAIIFVATRAPR